MPKRKAAASSGKKKKPALDWRVPIFYWRGTLTGKTWQGTWVASEFGLPSDDDFKASENTFKLECSEMLSLVAAGAHNSTKNWEAEGAKFTGSYKLDNGDGLEDTEDIEHLIWAVKGPPSHHPLGDIFDWATVGACGDTPRLSATRLVQRCPNVAIANSISPVSAARASTPWARCRTVISRHLGS